MLECPPNKYRPEAAFAKNGHSFPAGRWGTMSTQPQWARWLPCPKPEIEPEEDSCTLSKKIDISRSARWEAALNVSKISPEFRWSSSCRIASSSGGQVPKAGRYNIDCHPRIANTSGRCWRFNSEPSSLGLSWDCSTKCSIAWSMEGLLS